MSKIFDISTIDESISNKKILKYTIGTILIGDALIGGYIPKELGETIIASVEYLRENYSTLIESYKHTELVFEKYFNLMEPTLRFAEGGIGLLMITDKVTNKEYLGKNKIPTIE